MKQSTEIDDSKVLQTVVAEAGFTRGIIGDINHDLSLDAGDWVIFRDNYGNDLTGLTGLEAYQWGDLDGDSDIDVFDFAIFEGAYDLANGTGAFAAMVNSIPEPTSGLEFW